MLREIWDDIDSNKFGGKMYLNALVTLVNMLKIKKRVQRYLISLNFGQQSAIESQQTQQMFIYRKHCLWGAYTTFFSRAAVQKYKLQERTGDQRRGNWLIDEDRRFRSEPRHTQPNRVRDAELHSGEQRNIDRCRATHWLAEEHTQMQSSDVYDCYSTAAAGKNCILMYAYVVQISNISNYYVGFPRGKWLSLHG